jgi:hypothetical protein
VDFFQSLGIVASLTVRFRHHARYGIMASQYSYRNSPGVPSGSIDLLPPLAAVRFLITFMPEVHLCELIVFAGHFALS